MVTETILIETGDAEPLTVSIANLLETKWGAGTDTDGKVPAIKSDEGVNTTQASQKGFADKILVNKLSEGPYTLDNYNAGWSRMAMVTSIRIDIYAQNATRKDLYEAKISQILRINMPNPQLGVYLVKKNDPTKYSRACGWADPALLWQSPKIDSSVMQQKASFSSATLRVLWEKTYT